MKIISSLLILLCSSLTVSATVDTVTSISENFDASCTVVGPNYPAGWSEWNTVPPISALAWNCGPASGRWGTGGMECTSFIGGVNYKDTAWLFSPLLKLADYPGKVYLRFDSKYEFIAARLSVFVNVNTSYVPGHNPDSSGTDWAEMTSSMTPVINPNTDSADWVTHQVDLSTFKLAPTFIAFRYTSTASTGGVWTIDNVYTTTFPLDVINVSKELLPITVLGTSSTSRIDFECGIKKAGSYKVGVYDILGREVYHENIEANGGPQKIALKNLQLTSGMYIIKVGDEVSYGYAKTIVQ